MQHFRLADDSKHKELAALSAFLLASETSPLSICAYQGQTLSRHPRDDIYFSPISYRHLLAICAAAEKNQRNACFINKI